MKVNESAEDRYGRACIVFSGVKKFSEVYAWLYDHYNGYRFAVMIDVSQECDDVDFTNNDIVVNFFDELEEEMMCECGFNKYTEDGKTVYRRR